MIGETRGAPRRTTCGPWHHYRMLAGRCLVGPGACCVVSRRGENRRAAAQMLGALAVAAWTVEQAGVTVSAFVKARASVAWSVAKSHVATGKVFVDGACVTAVDHRLAVGQAVELRLGAQRPRDPERDGVLVYDDAHVVVIDKPSGVNSVPYEERELGTAMDLVRGAWRRAGKPATTVPLHVVHRIDRGTSGLLMFAKTKKAELGLAAQLRAHTMERSYVCVAHGEVGSARIESLLARDRGDGLRGSTTRGGAGLGAGGGARQARGDPRRGRRVAAPRDGVPGPARDRQDPPDPDPPVGGRPSAGRRAGLHPRLHRAGADLGAADAARGDARLRAPGDRRAGPAGVGAAAGLHRRGRPAEALAHTNDLGWPVASITDIQRSSAGLTCLRLRAASGIGTWTNRACQRAIHISVLAD